MKSMSASKVKQRIDIRRIRITGTFLEQTLHTNVEYNVMSVDSLKSLEAISKSCRETPTVASSTSMLFLTRFDCVEPLASSSAASIWQSRGKNWLKPEIN